MPPDNSPSAGRPEQHYSNRLEVGFNSVEFLLRFGQAREGERETVILEVVTNPTFARSFSLTLAEAVSHYEARFGRIPEAES